MDRQFEDRLATVERALTDGETDLEAVAEGAATAEQVADLEDRLGRLEDEVADLDAATQALRGYVGEVRSINEDVEETAASAMAKAERAQSAADGAPRSPGGGAAAAEFSSDRIATDGSARATPGAAGLRDLGPAEPTAGEASATDEDRCGNPPHDRPQETDDTHPSRAGGASADARGVDTDPGSERCPRCGRDAGRDAGDGRHSVGSTGTNRARAEEAYPVFDPGQQVDDRRVPEPAHRTESERPHRMESQPHDDGPSSRRGGPVSDRGHSDAGFLARIRERL
ncbi:MAG: hypothetical protein V5A18_00320 [Haloarculaceae archaeon]